jgi:hypothetical protein
MNGQIRTWKESSQARGTHFLESIETSYNMEGIQINKGHLHPKVQKELEHRRKLSK